jgi:hypothetical protein
MTARSDPPAQPRPAATILHRTVREQLETFLAIAQAGDNDLRPIRPAAERARREYLPAASRLTASPRSSCV